MSPHHIYLAAILCFIVGDALHALAQIDSVAKANKQTRRQVFTDRWIRIVVRGGVSTFIFVLWLEGELADTLRSVHMQISPTIQSALDLHINNGPLAGLIGYAFDSALGYVPFLQKIGIPPAVDQTTLPPDAKP